MSKHAQRLARRTDELHAHVSPNTTVLITTLAVML
jgi:hypothetical protein